MTLQQYHEDYTFWETQVVSQVSPYLTYFLWKNVGTGTCLQVEASTQNTQNVVTMQPCNASNTSQQFYVTFSAGNIGNDRIYYNVATRHILGIQIWHVTAPTSAFDIRLENTRSK